MSSKRGPKSGGETAASNGKAPANAWSRPLQPKRPAGPPPGMGPPSANNFESPSSSVMLQNRERLLHLSLTLIGQKVILEQTDGAVYEGIFHTFTPFTSLPAENRNKYVLKEIRIQRQPSTSNGGSSAAKNGSTLIVPADRVVYLHAKNVDLERPDRAAANNMNGAAASEDGFVTDTQISGAKGAKDRDLVAAGSAWTTADNKNANGGNHRNQALNAPLQTNSRAAALGGSKNNTKVPGGAAPVGKLAGSIGEWDQFKANEELFNVNASFDENLYTTQLDKGAIDSRKIAEAERIAREIETSTTDNAHLAEERGHKIENDFRDEEDKYSGVLTEDMKQRHEKANTDSGAKVKSSASGERSVPTASSGPKKVMNYAAAAAKADPSKKTTPPGFAGSAPAANLPKDSKDDIAAPSKESTTTIATPDGKDKKHAGSSKADAKKDEEKQKPTKSTGGSTKAESQNAAADKKEPVVSKEDNKDVKKDVKKTSKLNANAKSFTFNPAAKSFTPSFGGGAAQPSQPNVPTDPNMAMYGGHSMQPHHYMQAPPMGQPGMMHMMNPQYPGMRYPQPVPQMPPQGQQLQSGGPPAQAPTSGTATSGTTSAGSNDEDTTPTQDGEASQPSTGGGQQKPQPTTSDQQGAPSQQQQPQQMAMAYGVPPGAYFPGGAMAMPPRGPGFPPQFVAGPQQIPGRPGVAPYGMFPMQPGGMPPNMPMRGPNGAPYYPGPNGPMPYPPGAYMGHGVIEDGNNDPNYRGRGRGSGGGRGRGRGRGGGRGRGRGGYNSNNHHQNSGNNSGRNTPQQQQQQQQGPPTTDGSPPSSKQNETTNSKNEGEGQ